MKKVLFFTVVLAALVLSVSAQYTEIFTQPYATEAGVPSPGTLTTSVLDTAQAVDYEVADNFTGLTDPINKITVYGGSLLYNAGWTPAPPAPIEPFNIRFYEVTGGWTQPPQPLTAEITGTYTVNLYDDYGDGWNGGLLDVLVNGVVVLNDITCAAAGPDAFTFLANAGDEISTVYTAGSWSYENWYEILDPNMAVIATDGDPGVTAPTGLFVPVPLIAAETGTYTVNLYDTYGDGWNGGSLDVYVAGVEVLSNLTIASGAGPEAHTFSANAGDEIATVFTAGSWSSENWYEILDPNLAVIATDGPGPLGIGFISTYVTNEPDWANPVKEYLSIPAATSFLVDLPWSINVPYYMYEIVLPEAVTMATGWVSAQIDVDGGAGQWFLWSDCDPAYGDGSAWQKGAKSAKGIADHKFVNTKLRNDGGTREEVLYDMAFQLYTEDGPEPITITFNTDPATEGVAVYLDGVLLGYTDVNGEFEYTGLPEDLVGEYTFVGGGYNWPPVNIETPPTPNQEYPVVPVPVTPVELSSFTAMVTAINDVELTWVSETETNMNGYRVYRNTSADQNGSISITPILIPAANTSTTHTYSITDDSVEIGDTYFYWLEAVDYQSSDFHGPVSVTVTGNVPPVMPEVTSLKNAYPNPFKTNSSTNIEVALKAGETGSISIYNLNGQLVRTFEVNEGSHTIAWNGKDNRGSACGSGIYFYKLSTPSFNQTRKMVIVK